MARSIFKLQERDLGFNPEGVVVARIELNWSKYQNADVRRDFLKRVEREVAALPEAGAVAVASTYPLDGAAETDPNDRVDLIVRGATDQNAGTQSPVIGAPCDRRPYFETLQVPVLGGRAFTANDDERSEQVVDRERADGGDALARRQRHRPVGFRGPGPNVAQGRRYRR